MKIVVYSKPACVQCVATTRAMDARGIPYDVVDLTRDAEAMERVMGMGYRQAPVIVAGETEDMHWAGFQPGKIDELVKQMAQAGAEAPVAAARLTA